VAGIPSEQSTTSSGQCTGLCLANDSGCVQGNTNAVIVDGNFNTVTNNTQNLSVDWIQNCMYNAQVTQNVTNSLQSAIDAASSAATYGNSPFTIFGWLLWLAFIFVLLGGLFIAGRWAYRKYGTSN
jgi:hypothetical protein